MDALKSVVGCAFETLEPLLHELQGTLHEIGVTCTSADRNWGSSEAAVARIEKLTAADE